VHSSSCLFSLGALGRVKKQQATRETGVACCTNDGRVNRPKAGQYTEKGKLNALSPTICHLRRSGGFIDSQVSRKTPQIPVGASLLAIAVGQSNQHWLTHRYREQARSHKGLHGFQEPATPCATPPSSLRHSNRTLALRTRAQRYRRISSGTCHCAPPQITNSPRASSLRTLR